MAIRSSDFKLEVFTSGGNCVTPSLNTSLDAELTKYYGHVSMDRVPGGHIHTYEGTWQSMKYLASTLEKRFSLTPSLTYQGKWSKTLPEICR